MTQFYGARRSLGILTTAILPYGNRDGLTFQDNITSNVFYTSIKLKVNTFQIYKQIVSSRSCFWPNVGQMKSSQDIILSIPNAES